MIVVTLLVVIPLLLAVGSAAKPDLVVNKEKVTVQFAADAINASGAKIDHLIALPEWNNTWEIYFSYKDGNVFLAEGISDSGILYMGTTRPLKNMPDEGPCALIRSANSANYFTMPSRPVVIFRIEDDYFEARSQYTYGQTVSQNELTDYFRSVDITIGDRYSGSQTLKYAYGNWSK